jgi:outer membrane protein OmpA-like peptidoglycan-associated protein
MPTSKKVIISAFALSICLAPAFAQATELSNNKVVRDQRGKVVHAAESGTCVRTVWEAGGDVCAPLVEEKVVKTTYVAPPPPPPPPQIVQERKEILSKDEKVVYFPFDSAELVPEAKAKLDTVAQKLSNASSVQGADIVGYADRMGANNYNMTLSQKRAKAVQDYLAGQGYLHTHLARVRGLGESNSVTNCTSKMKRESQIACLGADRRVELEVQYTQTKIENKLIQPAVAPAPPVQGQLMYTQPAQAPGTGY